MRFRTAAGASRADEQAMKSFRASFLLLLAAATLSATAAQAISSRALLALDVVVDDSAAPDGFRHFASLKKVLAGLKREGWSCKYSPYEYGADIRCSATGKKEFLIDLVGVPTLAPDFAEIDSIRPDGVNSTPVPKAEMGGYLGNLLRLKDTSAKR